MKARKSEVGKLHSYLININHVESISSSMRSNRLVFNVSRQSTHVNLETLLAL